MVWMVFLIILSLSTWNINALESEHDEVIYAEIGKVKRIHFDANNNCTVITNNNELFEYNNDGDNKPLPYWLKYADRCYEFDFRVSGNCTGSWTFRSDKGFEKKVYIFAYKERKKNVNDYTEDIRARQNASVWQWIPSHSIEITSCYLIHEFEEENKPKFIIRNLTLQTETETMQSIGKCGVRLRAIEENIGSFKLFANDSSGQAIISSFTISIIQDVTLHDTIYINDVVSRGKKNYIMSHGSEDLKSNYCTVTDPHGKIFVIENDVCRHNISLVTSYHHGIWLLRKFDSNHDEAFDYQYNLTVVDDVMRVKVNVTYNEDYLTILCNTTGQHVLTTCKFINPSNQYITAALGMSTEKYEYWGEYFGPSYKYQECGIVVHNLTEQDYGTWKCIMTTENGEIVDSLISVHDNPEKIEILHESQNTLYVTTNSSFAVRCRANRRLSYCWLRSPNGTMFFVGQENSEFNILQYEGSGLDMGECGAKIPNGSLSYHDGLWSCHMGIENGPDLQSTITVNVLDSVVIPVQNKIEVSTGDTVTLSVAAISGFTFEDDNCEWVSPAGTVILRNYDTNYIVTSNQSLCSVAIQGVIASEHIGSWTCFLLHGDKKIQTIIEVTSQSNHTWWIFLIAAIVTCLILGAAFYFIMKIVKNVSKSENLLSNVSTMTTEDPPHIDRTNV